MTQRKSVMDRIKWSLGTEQELNQAIVESKTPEVQLCGGVYRATLPTYSDTDNAIMHFTSDGKLMVDTELTLDGSIIINNLGGAAAKDAAIAGNPVQIGIEAADFDGSALPGPVNAEGDVTYPQGSLYGVQYVMFVSEDGSATPLIPHDTAIGTGLGTSGLMIVAEAKDFDGAALPNNVVEGDASRVATTLSGVQFAFLVNKDGSKTVTVVDDEAQVAAPIFMNSGGEYNATPIIYTDGDGTIFLTDVNGRLQVTTSGTSKYENAAYAETEDEANDSEFATSVIYGYDSEAAANSRLRTVQVAVDNAGISATPNILVGGGIYKNVYDVYDDNDAVPFHFDVGGRLLAGLTDASGNRTPAGDAVGRSIYTAMGDGTSTVVVNVANAETEDEDSNSIFTASVLYGFDSEAVANSKLRAAQVVADNAAASATPNVLVSGGIYKSSLDTYDDNDAVPFHFDVNGLLKTGRERLATAAVQTASVIHAAETVMGSEINVSAYNTMVLFVVYAKGDESSVDIIPKALHTSAGTEYPLNSWSQTGGTKTVTADTYRLSASGSHYIVLDITGINYVKLYEDATGGTPTGTLAVNYTLSNN